ncbi:MAG: alpha-glucan family phosphorylase [Desulfobacterales bacterium]
MKKLQTFQVLWYLPEPIQFLETLAMNFWWSWKRDAIELFRRIDPLKWEASGKNPIAFLSMLSQKRLEQSSKDPSFLAHQNRVMEDFRYRVLSEREQPGEYFGRNETIAYFSMEFGIHESLPIFAGGLGILAGDHLKSASNMGLPLTGVGLLYRRGYFKQLVNSDGWQGEEYPEIDYYNLPIVRAQDINGRDARINVTGPSGDIHADVWKIQVGKIPLYLLDANIHENPPEIRAITSNLYTGDLKLRLSQEVLLGIGGMKALAAMGIYPKVYHMNEGHCAFCGVERLAQIMTDHHVDLKTALEILPRTTIFTTHTPVAAGHDEFGTDLVIPVLKPYENIFHTSVEEILSWGQVSGPNPTEPLSMFILGMHLAQYRNGVSKLHGSTARQMWSHVWPDRPLNDVPISYVTNGIHISSFITPEISSLFDRYLGPDWYLGSRRPENIELIDSIPDEELWWAHELSRARLINICRQRLVRQYKRQNAPLNLIEDMEMALDNDTLTIGFARRFATYKRAYLPFSDPDRLESILNSENRPVQFVFAGKAHPRDHEGKDIIKRLVEFTHRPGAKRKIVYLEDYNMDLARYLIQGVDAWLNTPRRPYEACGTSGMKAAVNGVLNISILDGWWVEGYSPNTGWAIGNGEEYRDFAYQDFVESQALYNILENEIIPTFYGRKNGDLPFMWLAKMKASMKMVMQHFCSHRMVHEYENRYYNMAARRHDAMLADNAAEAKRIADQVRRYRRLWNRIRIEEPKRERAGSFRVGERFEVSAVVFLGELKPEEVAVELYYGPYKELAEFTAGEAIPMSAKEDLGNGAYLYGCMMDCRNAGRFGFTARVTPTGDQRTILTPKLITWA